MQFLEGKVALITGASRGIGRAIALAFGQVGASVAVTARSTTALDAVVTAVCDNGSAALAITADLSLEADIQRIADSALSHFGRIDILVNNAGAVALPGPSGDEVWVGLRAPLVEGKAVLIRHKAGLKALEFDAARLVDLDGWGIRDLTYARGWVWGLSGPVHDDDVTAFRLWRFRVGALGLKGAIRVMPIGEVPNSAEGLAIWGSVAVVLIDGSELKETSSAY